MSFSWLLRHLYHIHCLQVKLNAALTGIKFINYDWEVVTRNGKVVTYFIISYDVFTDKQVCRRYSYDGKAGRMSFSITFEVEVTQLQEVCFP